MKSLEEIISADRSSFDDQEPNQGHAKRFEQKLRKVSEEPKSNNPMQMVWWAAAVIVGILFVTRAVPNGEGEMDQPIQQATIGLSDISPEMAEVEGYFSDQIRTKKRSIVSTDSEEMIGQLVAGQLHQLEEDYEALRQELNHHQGDQRIVRYMVENYRLRLMLLEMHLEKIEKYEQQNRLVN
ncbi:MAG: hypothetical protein HQ500_08585 [Flavobacteriales bacterium]|nr:hypothetical protein [Flavobacteriales bacterium]